MLRQRRLNADGRPRGRPSLKMRLALIALAITTMGLDGCSFLQSNGIGGGCSSCGGLGGLRRTRILFRRRDPGCCGAATGGTVIEGAAPVVIPGAAPMTPITPAAPGEAAGAIPDLSPADDPAPTSRNSNSSPSGSGTSSTPANSPTKSGYTTTHQSRSRPSGGGSLARSIPDLEPTPGSASVRGQGPGVTLSENLIDNLPPPEVQDTPPAPTEPPANVASPSPPVTGLGDADANPTPPPLILGPDPVDESAAPSPASVALGIDHFQVVDSRLAGGSFPNGTGLAWLAEKSYQTLLDLRERDQIRSEDFAAIDHQGLRYVALPVSSATLGPALIKRFERELAQSDARPLYFCDADGTRAATLWYIHRVSVDHRDRASSRKEAEALGTMDITFVNAANAYLDTLAPAALNWPNPTQTPPLAETVNRLIIPTTYDPPGSPRKGPDSTGWHPYAALAMTALGVPFAYWSCGQVNVRSLRRASLPAPGPRSKALPPVSDV